MKHPISTNTNWSLTRKLLALFGMTYLLLYMLPFPLDNIPGISYIATWYNKGMDSIILFTGRRLLHMPTLVKIDSGSGDTTFDYVRLLAIIICSLIMAPVVLIITRKYNNYSKWYNLLILYARYYLGVYIIFYGMAKFFEGKFGSPGLQLLEQSFGNSSPMRLLWTFMGYSKPYTVFTGVFETLAGFLLFFRRTTALGCLVTIAVMANVVMLNFCYDVPVKLFSAHLLFIAFVILWPEIKTLYAFFIRHTPVALQKSKLFLPKKWMRITRIIVKSLIIAFPVLAYVFEIGKDNRDADAYVHHNLNGMYRMDIFSASDSLTKKWNKLVLDGDDAIIYTGYDSLQIFNLIVDSVHKKINIKNYNDTTDKYSLAYNMRSGNRLTVWGKHRSDSIFATFKRKQITDYRLVNRGFHWITEDPYNR